MSNEIISALPRGRFAITASVSLLMLVTAIGVRILHVGEVPVAYERTTPLSASDTIPEEFTFTTATMPLWQQNIMASVSNTENATATPDDIALSRAGDAIADGIAGSYIALKQSGTYTPDNIERIAANAAADMRLTPTFAVVARESLTLSSDTSYARMLSYRSDMRVALAPLLENRSAEFELFARYIDTHNTTYLSQLHTSAERYRAAAAAAQTVTVPEDAVGQHLRAINSLVQFSVVLDDMAKHAPDPLTSLVLLRTYTAAQQEVFESFNMLAAYYAGKKNV